MTILFGTSTFLVMPLIDVRAEMFDKAVMRDFIDGMLGDWFKGAVCHFAGFRAGAWNEFPRA